MALTAKVGPENFANFARHLDAAWIDETLLTTGTAALRKRRLPAERVVWLVIGMALIRDRPIAEVVRQLDLTLPAAVKIKMSNYARKRPSRRGGTQTDRYWA